jgi:hypothetical protein
MGSKLAYCAVIAFRDSDVPRSHSVFVGLANTSVVLQQKAEDFMFAIYYSKV